MKFRRHLLVLGAVILAVAANFWLHTPATTQAAPPPDIKLSLTRLPATGLTATIWWSPDPEASTQWVDLARLDGSWDHGFYEGAGPMPISINSHAAGVHTYSVYTVRIVEFIQGSGSWGSQPDFYFETGACGGPNPAPAPCFMPLCGGEFAGYGQLGQAPAPFAYLTPGGPGPIPYYPAFPPTIVQYPAAYFIPGFAGYYGGCHPSYAGACVPMGLGDYDCKGGVGQGPNFVKGTIVVIGPDTYNLDTNGDGVACSGAPEVYPRDCFFDNNHHDGWWGGHGDWHNDWDHDGWDDNDWDHHDWDNDHHDWSHDWDWNNWGCHNNWDWDHHDGYGNDHDYGHNNDYHDNW